MMCIDHDHETGFVRGILCSLCNTLLGHAKDDPEILRKAAEYLDRDLISNKKDSLLRVQDPDVFVMGSA